MLNADLTDQEREALQARVEKLHRNWAKDRNCLPPPMVGKLAEIDPALIVTPPPGLEAGHVPILTLQAAKEQIGVFPIAPRLRRAASFGLQKPYHRLRQAMADEAINPGAAEVVAFPMADGQIVLPLGLQTQFTSTRSGSAGEMAGVNIPPPPLKPRLVQHRHPISVHCSSFVCRAFMAGAREKSFTGTSGMMP